ncbi:TetR family transcriptional regulator [Flavobacterium crassostreae]|uniref:Transcriptional regulator n=1 Tax=Flavobacterium crassostreae TaxID=1763534 RepID=A0A1B9EA60_9FLAO|nr:TetR family transcriptional regulator [Flavobacterium crassostreae]OCB78768.1 transcriptional regulator [Flavobacterium crassostreae]
MPFTTEFNSKQIQILEVAESLFAEKGFDGTPIRTIAKEAKINVAMVSYYFGSKEGLLESLVLFRTKDLKAMIDALLLQNISSKEKINKLIEIYIHQINANKGIYRILHFEVATKKRDLDIDAFTALRKSNFNALEAIVLIGQEEGIFKKDIAIPLLTPTILGTFFHFHMNKEYFKTLLHLDSEEAYDQYIVQDLTQHIQQTIKALLMI